MTNLPSAVQKSVDAANKAAADAGIKNASQASGNALQAGLAHGSAGDQANAASKVAPAPAEGAPAPAGEVAPAQSADVTPIDWKRRYGAMKGQYDAEVPRLKAEIDTLRTQMAQLQAASMPPAAAPSSEAASAATPQDSRWYNDEQLEEFGQDFFDLVDRRVGMIEQSYGDKISSLVKENDLLKQRLVELGQGVQKVQSQPLFTVLDNSLPQWKELNSDPAFLAWANETPVSDLDDRTMLTAMRTLFDRGRVEGVVKIFRTYLEQSREAPDQARQRQAPAMPGTPQGSQPPAAPASQFAAPTAHQPVDMGSLAGPGTSQESGADPLAQQRSARVWTDATIGEFYDQVRRGALQPQEVQALEADLQQAISPEGRRAGRYRPK